MLVVTIALELQFGSMKNFRMNSLFVFNYSNYKLI